MYYDESINCTCPKAVTKFENEKSNITISTEKAIKNCFWKPRDINNCQQQRRSFWAVGTIPLPWRASGQQI